MIRRAGDAAADSVTSHAVPQRGRREGRTIGAPRSVADLAVGELRRLIITGELAQGEHLHEQRLADQLGVSRAGLREALRTLQSDGLVRLVPGAGCRVVTLTDTDIREIIRLREHLEDLVLEVGIPADDDALAAFDAAVRMLERNAANDQESTAALDSLDVHRAFVALARMPRLDTLFGVLAQQLGMVMHLNRQANAPRETLVERAARHRRLVDVVRSGDAEAVRDELRSHPTTALIDGPASV